MRCLMRGAVLGTFFFLCSFLHSGVDIHEQCNYHIQHDQFGKPNKVCVEAYRVVIPIMDGIPLFDQREEYICKQEYNVIHNVMEEQKHKLSFHVNVPRYTGSASYNISESRLRSQIKKSGGLYTGVRTTFAYQDAFSKMSDNELASLLIASTLRKKWLKTIPDHKDYLRFVQHKKFIEKLFKTDGLSEEAVWALWQEFQDQKLIKDNGTYEEKIKQWLTVRSEQKKDLISQELQKKIEKVKQVAQQELQNVCNEGWQQLLEQQHKLVQNSYIVNDWVTDEMEQARDHALEQAELEGYMQYDQQYEIDAITCGYLSHKHIAYVEYLHCYGTALQQQYHQEMCNILTQVAHQNLKVENRLQAHYQSPILEHAINFAQAAHETNQKNWISITGVLTSIGQHCVDVAQELYSRPLEYLKAAAEGFGESAWDTIHMMVRPDKAIYSLGQMLFYVLDTAALIEASTEFPDYACPKLQERYDQISTALFTMQQEFMHADGPARVKAITKFGADFYLPAKLTHAAGYMLGGVCSRARNMRSLEGVAGLVDEGLGVAEVLEETAEKIRELEAATEQGFTQKITAEFMEAEKIIAQTGNIVARPLKVLIDEIKKLGGVIPLHCKELAKEFKLALKELEHQLKISKLKKLKELYGEKIIDNRKVKLALEHICNFELNLVKDRRVGGFVLKIGGGHLSGVCEALEKTGLIKIFNKKDSTSGIIDYVLQNALTGKIFNEPKTIFPSSWKEEKIIEAIWHIYEDPLLAIKEAKNGALYKVGVFENIKIKVLWSKKGKNEQVFNYINTAFPLIK